MNLKTAARRLGVHYQTAYRWVRSGELVAVKIGAGYEISEAALERFEAQRAAMERIPAPPDRPGVGVGSATTCLPRRSPICARWCAAPRSTRARSVSGQHRCSQPSIGDAVTVSLRDEDGSLRLAAFDHPRRGTRGRHGRDAPIRNVARSDVRPSGRGHGRNRARAAGATTRRAYADPARIPRVPRGSRFLQRDQRADRRRRQRSRGRPGVARHAWATAHDRRSRLRAARRRAHRSRDRAGRTRTRGVGGASEDGRRAR